MDSTRRYNWNSAIALLPGIQRYKALAHQIWKKKKKETGILSVTVNVD